MDEEEIIEEPAPRRPRRRWRWVLLALLLLLIAGLTILWAMREQLAADYIESELASRGVQASYEVRRIGYGSQILENVVIGDPARPDAVIRRLEVGIALGLYGPEIGTITARGESAASAEISRPRFMGPGCRTTAWSGSIARRCASSP